MELQRRSDALIRTRRVFAEAKNKEKGILLNITVAYRNITRYAQVMACFR